MARRRALRRLYGASAVWVVLAAWVVLAPLSVLAAWVVVAPSSALALPPDEGSSPAPLPPDLAPASFRFPIQLVLAIEDSDWETAQRELEQALASSPEDLALREERQVLEVDRDPLAFLARELPLLGEGAPVADRYEACHHQVLRLEVERAFYRGDRAEGAAAFIARQEKQAARIGEELDRLEQLRPVSPWVLLTHARLRNDLHALGVEQATAVWEATADAGPWRRYLRLVVLETGIAPVEAGLQWLEKELPAAREQGDPLAGKIQLLALRLRAASLSRHESIALYAEADEDFPAGVFRDDFDLAYARELAYAYNPETRQRAVARFTPLLEPPLRNTTYDAMLELGGLLRRLKRHPEALERYEAFHRRFPNPLCRFDRQMGRSYYTLERYPEAIDAFQRSAEGPRGNGADYQYLAEAMRFLPQEPAGQGNPVRERALKLTDFASAAMQEETRVRNWVNGEPWQLADLQCRFIELVALSRHALLFPFTFLSVGLQAFLELLVLGLGLIVFVSYPRLSRRVWRTAAAVTVMGLCLPAVAMAMKLPMPVGTAANLAWMGQSGVRLFFVLTGGMVLSPVVGLQGLEFFRAFRRSWRLGRPGAWLRQMVPVAVSAGALVGLGLAGRQLGLEPIGYLERFPSILSGAELGAVKGEVEPLTRACLLLFNVFRTEILARGFLLALLAYLFQRRSYGPSLAVVTGAGLWALLTGGLMEPAPLQCALVLSQSLLLGWLRMRRGIDSALVAHGAATLLTGGAV